MKGTRLEVIRNEPVEGKLASFNVFIDGVQRGFIVEVSAGVYEGYPVSLDGYVIVTTYRRKVNTVIEAVGTLLT